MEIVDIIFREYYNILENKQNIKDMILNESEVSEQFEFGFYSVDRSGAAKIKRAEKIYSALNGRIQNSLKKTSSCTNPVVIVDRSGNFFLEYCNISEVYVSDNQKVDTTTILGKTRGSDVTVRLYSKTGRQIEIDSDEAIRLVQGEKDPNKNNADDKTKELEKQKTVARSAEPLITGLFTLPFKMLSYPFKDKTNKKGEITQKRFASPVDKVQPDPWILQSLKDPFGVKRRKKDKENQVTEEINRIKELIK